MKLIIAIALLLALASASRHRPQGRLFRQGGGGGGGSGPTQAEKDFCATEFDHEDWDEKCEAVHWLWGSEEWGWYSEWHPDMSCTEEADSVEGDWHGWCTDHKGNDHECWWWTEEDYSLLLKMRLRHKDGDDHLEGDCAADKGPSDKHICYWEHEEDDDGEILYEWQECFEAKVKPPPKNDGGSGPGAALHKARHHPHPKH